MRGAVIILFVLGPLACSPEPPVPDSGAPDSGVPDAGTPDAGCSMVVRPDGGDLPPAVWAVMVKKCQTCHTQPLLNGAHQKLLTYEDTQTRYGITDKQYWQRMGEVIQPDGSPHMPYMNAPQLTTDEFDTLNGWIDACALPVPEGTGCDSLSDGGVMPTSAVCDAGQ